MRWSFAHNISILVCRWRWPGDDAFVFGRHAGAQRWGRRLAQVGLVAELMVLCGVRVAEPSKRCSRSVLGSAGRASRPATRAPARLFSVSDASDDDGAGRGPTVVSVASSFCV